MANELPEWGIYPKGIKKFQYVHAQLDNDNQPLLSGEDFRAVSDFPAIYVYVSKKQENGTRFFYIGQSIKINQRVNQHKEKLKDNNNRFNYFRGGEYFAFYGEEISNNLNYIEKLLISTFIKEFQFLNFIPRKDKDIEYVSKLLANKDKGNDSGKYQQIREEIERNIVNNILKLLRNKGIIEKKYDVSKVSSSLFSESPFFELKKEQNDIKDAILNSASNIHLIEGEPGTGKTVLLLHLIAAIKQKDKDARIAVFLKHTHRAVFQKNLKSYGLDPKKFRIDIDITSGSLIKSDFEYDYLIIDEAQRTTRLQSNLKYPTGAKYDTDTLMTLNGISKDEKELSEENYKKLKYPSILSYLWC